MGRGSDIGDSGQASERSGIHTARALLLGPGARRGQAIGHFERWAAARDSAQATLTMLCHPLVAAVGRAEGMVVARRMLRSRVRRARSRSIICRRGPACASGHMDHQRSSNPTVHRRVARPNGGHGQEGGNTRDMYTSLYVQYARKSITTKHINKTRSNCHSETKAIHNHHHHILSRCHASHIRI